MGDMEYVSSPHLFMEGYLISHLLVWFNPGFPNLSNSLLRAVFSIEVIYFSTRVSNANMADFGHMTIILFAKLSHCRKM